MGLVCYLCSSDFPNVEYLIYHLRRVHTIQLNGEEVKCGQNDCPRIFTCLKVLKKHLVKEHDQAENEQAGCNHDQAEVPMEHEPDGFAEQCESDMSTDDLHEYLQTALLSFMCSLSSRPNLAMANVIFVMDQLRELLDVLMKYCCSRVEKLCDIFAIDQDNSAKLELVHDFSSFPKYIDEVATKHKMEKALVNTGFYVKPVEIALGTREERHYSQQGVVSRSVRVEDTMQYIPLGPLLKTISVPLRQCLLNAQPASRAGMISDFSDTVSFRYNPVLSKHPDAFQLHLFVDAFETTNELGSHSSVHKLEGLYMTIKNAPTVVNSQLDNIFLVGLWYSEDVKRYGYEKILRPLVDDIKRLESPEGSSVGETVRESFHASLVLFSADNLGAHSLFGFLESFSAKKFCRLCEAAKPCQDKFLECEFILRTPDSYNAAVEKLDNEGYDSSATGIKRACILNEIPSFHVTQNYALDAMHDLLEGVIPYELEAVLPLLVQKKYFSETELQARITGFSYGPSDYNSKTLNDSFVGCARGVVDCNICGGINSTTAREEVDKMNAISVSRRHEVLDSAKRSFCFRQATHAKLPFAKAVELCSKYQTLPEIFHQDFVVLHGDVASNSLLTGFSSLVGRILQYAETSGVIYLKALAATASGSNDNIRAVCALKCLLHLLPSTGKDRISASEAFTRLVIFCPDSESVEMHAVKERAHNQPQLIIQGREDVGVFNSFSIVCERIVCCAGTSLAESMDTMFKMYWVFQMHYPPGLQVFMKFLQSVYKIVYANERMPNRVSELRKILQLQ